ncbi:STAS domain-containing protein [uncultured Croceicoccus sp.]|uniref:STAS domain-containing protein n=1 Tax=uncultured Croceicoccus sp. TaxID=1295329 RepID=UPI002601D8BB|nr:STAS domain-containing protein [uncultured Croceicoccus sp.]
MSVIELPALCDRDAAIAICPELREAVGEQPVRVDASAVERIGVAMLQLLVSAAHTAGGVAVVDPSDQFEEALRIAGLASKFNRGETA